MADRRFITFSAGGHSFAVPIEDVREVVTSSLIFPIPGGRRPLLGILPYREKGVLPVFSLLEILGEQDARPGTLIVVAGSDESPIGYIVNGLGGIITGSGPEDEVSRYEGELEGPDGWIKGLLKNSGRDYILLEMGKVYDV